MSPDELLQLFRGGAATFESRTALAGCIRAGAARVAEAAGETGRAAATGRKALYLIEQLRGDAALEEPSRLSERIDDLVELLRPL